MEVIVGKRRQSTYLNLQNVVSANALVVHLMIRIISISPILIFHKRKPSGFLLVMPMSLPITKGDVQSAACRARSGNIAADKSPKARSMVLVSILCEPYPRIRVSAPKELTIEQKPATFSNREGQ